MTHLPFKSAQYSSKVRSTVTEYGRALAPQNLLPRQSLSCHCGGSAMDRAQLLLVALPIVLLCSDIINLFTSVPPPKPVHDRIRPSRPKFQPDPQQKPIDFPVQKSSSIGGLGVGSNVNINFCFSCSYRGNAVTMKKLLETAFPGIDVILANHPPPLPKLLLSKVVPVAQFGIIGIIMAGEQIFPRLGFMTPPPWYYSLSANRLGSIASTWLLGNFFQSSLLSSGAFEVYCNGELVFSKLREHRFPDQSELRDLVGKKITNQALVTGVGGGIWS